MIMNTGVLGGYCNLMFQEDMNGFKTETFGKTVPLDASWFAASPSRAVSSQVLVVEH